MITGWDLWACATYLRRQHGDDAKAAALNRSAELEVAGEQRGAAVFRRIAAGRRTGGRTGAGAA